MIRNWVQSTAAIFSFYLTVSRVNQVLEMRKLGLFKSGCFHGLDVILSTNQQHQNTNVHGPLVWNSLPDELRSPDITLTTFRNKLKTLLFNV